MNILRSSLRSKFWAFFMSALLVWLVATQGVLPVVLLGEATGQASNARLLSAPTDSGPLAGKPATAYSGVKVDGAVISNSSSTRSTTTNSSAGQARLAPNAPNAVSITAGMTDTLQNDVDVDTKADPGDTIRYTVAITNSGNADGEGAVFSDTIDPNTTLVGGSLNVGPIAVNDSYATVGNTKLVVGVAPPAGEAAVQVTGPTATLFSNDKEFLGDTVAGDTLAAPTASANGGTVAVNTDGTFSYLPPLDFVGTDTFTYTLTDSGGLSDTATVSITISNMVWYVDNSKGSNGDGRSASPFNSLSGAGTARVNGAGGLGDADDPNEIIYIHTGSSDYTGGLPLEAGQTVIGQGVALVVNSLLLNPAGTRPTLVNTLDIITLSTNNTLRGFNTGDITPSGTGVDISGSGFGLLTTGDMALGGSGRPLSLTNGTLSAGFDSIDSTASTGGAGILLNQITGGTLVVTGTTSITNPTTQGIDIQNLSAGVSLNFGGTTVNKGSTAGTGVNLASNAGNLTFNSLSVTTNSGGGLVGTNNTGQINVTNGTAGISATGGPAVSITNPSVATTTPINITLLDASSSNSTAEGIYLDDVTGTFTANGGSITGIGASGTGVRLNGSNATVNYAGSITNSAGRTVEVTNRTGGAVTISGSLNCTSTCTGINVTGNSGGSTTFSSGTKTLNTATGTSNAVDLSSNTNHTIHFTGGGLVITTSSGKGFSATGGGTINVTGSGNTINTTSGQPVVMNSVTVGGSNITFDTLGASNFTANLDTLSFTSVGGAGASFNGGNVTVVSAASAADGIDINGSAATFNFSSATIDNTGGAAINLNGANGPVTFTTVNLDGMNGAGIAILNNTNAVNVNGGTIGATNDPAGNVVDIDGTNGAVNVAATLTKSSAGRIVEVTNRTGNAVSFSANLTCNSGCTGINVQNNTGGSGGTITFSGASQVLNTGASSAVTLDNNDSHIITFSGGNLDIDTSGTQTAFNALNGATGINVTGSANTIKTNNSSGTGTGLRIDDSNIGSSGLTFRSIDVTGAPNGIYLQNTGSLGGLTVTGNSSGNCGGAVKPSIVAANSADCTGGSIQNTTGADGSTDGSGVYLENTRDISLTRLRLSGHSNFAIRGVGVVNFTLNQTLIDGTNGTNENIFESSVFFSGLTGTASVNNLTVQGGRLDNFRVHNTSGTLNRITMANVTFNDNSSVGNNDLTFKAETAGTLNATVQESLFTAARAENMSATASENTSMDIVFGGATAALGNTARLDSPNEVTGAINVQIGLGGSTGAPNVTFNVRNNTFSGALAAALSLDKGGGGNNGTLSGTVANNTIGISGSAGSGAATGSGIVGTLTGGGTANFTIQNNTIFQYANFGIWVKGGNGNAGSPGNEHGYMTASITGNAASQPHYIGAAINGIRWDPGLISTDDTSFCMTITGNNVPNSSTDSAGNTSGALVRDIRVFGVTAVQPKAGVVGFGGGTSAQLEAYLVANNTADIAAVSPSTGTWASSCPVSFVPNLQRGQVTNETAQSAPANTYGANNTAVLAGSSGDRVAARPQVSAALPKTMDVVSAAPVRAEASVTRASEANLAAGGPVQKMGRVPGLASPPYVGIGSIQFAPAAVDSFPINLGTIPAGETIRMVFDVTVNGPPIAAGIDEVSNQGFVGGTNFDQVPTDDTDTPDANDPTITEIDAAPDLAIEKFDQGQTFQIGDVITYTLAYTNSGTQGATGVVLTDTVPANTTFNLGASTTGWSCADGAVESTVCNFTVGSLPANAGSNTGSKIFAVTIIVGNLTPPGGTITNTASIGDDNANGADQDPNDNSDTDTSEVDLPLPTATPSNTTAPATSTNTSVPATSTNTAVPATSTNTAVPATSTNTAVPATNTSVPATNTAVPATNTSVPATNTSVPATNTSVPATSTNTAVPATSTSTSIPATNTSVPATSTNTAVPATSTNTSVPATNTPIATSTGTLAITPSTTSTNVPGATSTNTSIATSTDVPGATSTNTSIATSIATSTGTLAITPSTTSTDVPGATSTNTSIATSTNTAVNVATSTTTNTPIATATGTLAITPSTTSTNVPGATSTNTSVATSTNTSVATSTNTSIATSTNTSVATSTNVPGATSTNTSIATSTNTSIATSTDVPGATSTNTSIATSIATSTNPAVSSATGTATTTPTVTSTIEASTTSTSTSTANPSGTSTYTPTVTPSGTSNPTASVTPETCDIEFPDVPPSQTFYQWIKCLACKGVVTGFPDGTFRPGASITRGQIAKVVSNAAGFFEDPGEQIYADVPPSNPYYAYINRLTNRGVVAGYPCPQRPGDPMGTEECTPDNASLYRPNMNATRGQLAKIVSNAAGFSEAVSGQFYADVPPTGEGSQFYEWIMRLTNRGVMSGYACGTLDPRSGPCDEQNRPYFRSYNEVTRGQAAKIVANTFFPNCTGVQD